MYRVTDRLEAVSLCRPGERILGGGYHMRLEPGAHLGSPEVWISEPRTDLVAPSGETVQGWFVRLAIGQQLFDGKGTYIDTDVVVSAVCVS
jgi:hypothetical protein